MAAACDGPQSQPPLQPPSATATPTPAPQIWCPAGLLCEAAEESLGWRTPRACQWTHSGKRTALCRISGVPKDAVVEFFASRYPGRLRQSGDQLEVSQPSAPFVTPSRLFGRFDGQAWVLKLVAGDGAAQVQ